MGAAPQASRSAGGPPRWLPYLVGVVSGLGLALVVGLLAGGPLALSHRVNFPLEKGFGEAAVGIASRLNAGGQSSPLANDPRAVATGRAAYTGSCGICHGASGDGKGVYGQATYPPATDLTAHDTQEKTDAQLFWIVKNGLSFTGMPGFANLYTDNDVWSIVAYVRTLGSGRTAQSVPTPTAAQLAVADPKGSAEQRGAAVYFAMNCASCHGAVGNAPGDLSLGRGQDVEEAVREGARGMPVYDESLISDADLAALQAYTGTFSGGQRRGD